MILLVNFINDVVFLVNCVLFVIMLFNNHGVKNENCVLIHLIEAATKNICKNCKYKLTGGKL